MAPVHRNKTNVYLEQTSTYFGSNTNTPAVITDGVVPAPKKPRKRLWALLAVLCMVVCVFIGWQLGRIGDSDRHPAETSTPTATVQSSASADPTVDIAAEPSPTPVPTPRAKIDSLTAVPSTDHVYLSWNSTNIPTGQVTYKIYRRESAGASDDWTLLAITDRQAYRDYEISSSTTYIYKLEVYVNGDLHDSNSVVVTTPSPTPSPTPVPTPRAKIDSLIADLFADHVSLSWSSSNVPAEQITYKFYRRESAGASENWTLLATTDRRAYHDYGISSSTTYIYTLEVYVNGDLHDSDSVVVTTPSPTPSPTPVPTPRAKIDSLTADLFADHVSLSWSSSNVPAEQITYKFYRRESAGASDDWTLLAATNRRAYRDYGISFRTTYIYKLEVYVNGDLHASDSVVVTTPSPTPSPTPVPTPRAKIDSLTADLFADYVSLSWSISNIPTGQVTYKIYRRDYAGASDDWTLLATTDRRAYHDYEISSSTTYIYKLEVYVNSNLHDSDSVVVTTPSPTPSPTPVPKVGDYITFGHYEQDGNEANGKEPIEWLVLDKQENRILVISRYGLENAPYNENGGNVTWERSTLRSFLNQEFLYEAFSPEERSKIPTVKVTAHWNLYYSTRPGNATQDQLFLLSIEEVNKYFSSRGAMRCQPTPYVSRKYDGYFPVQDVWWLRTPGNYQDRAAVVNYGSGVNHAGTQVTVKNYMVRPAMWITLDP